MSAFAPPPSVVPGSADCAFLPSLLRSAELRGKCNGESLSRPVPAAPCTPCLRTGAASVSFGDQAASSRSDPELAQAVSHHAFGRRRRLSIAGCHSRRRAGFSWFHFFPRSVGLGPTDSCASGAFTMAPSMLCQAQATPSRSSYSAKPFRHKRTNTPLRFHSRKYLWMELALPNCSSGSAFHWHPVRSTYTIPANTKRGSSGLRPPPGLRRYFRPRPRVRVGISGSTFAHNSSETVHDRVPMAEFCNIGPHVRKIII